MAASLPGTIVIVDEHPAFLELAEQALRAAGHRVLTTTHPREVIEVAQLVRIDVLVANGDFLDRIEPALVRRLYLAQPGLQVLYLNSLRMPFPFERLLEEVARLLNGSPRATDSPPGRLTIAQPD